MPQRTLPGPRDSGIYYPCSTQHNFFRCIQPWYESTHHVFGSFERTRTSNPVIHMDTNFIKMSWGYVVPTQHMQFLDIHRVYIYHFFPFIKKFNYFHMQLIYFFWPTKISKNKIGFNTKKNLDQ